MLAHRAKLVGLTALMVFIIAYLVLVLTPFGQSIDDQAFLARSDFGSATKKDASRVLSLIGISSVAIALLGIWLISRLEGSRLSPLRAISAFLGCVVSAEILKLVLPRPELDAFYEASLVNKDFNTFPSGHTAIAMSLALVLVSVSPSRHRQLAAAVGLGFTLVIASSVVLAGWHRPSDAIGGIALSAVVFSFLVFTNESFAERETRFRKTAVFALGLVGIGVLVWVLRLPSHADGSLTWLLAFFALISVTASYFVITLMRKVPVHK